MTMPFRLVLLALGVVLLGVVCQRRVQGQEIQITIKADITIVIGGPPLPKPVPPKPPEPIPPLPPKPVPPAELVAALKTALAKDDLQENTAATNRQCVKDLAVVAHETANACSSLPTVAAVSKHYQDNGQAKVGLWIPEVRKVASAYITPRVPADLNTPMTPALAKEMALVFTELGLALEATAANPPALKLAKLPGREAP